ncbi:hypothetical protein EDF58_102346 [Novosphingobium sp. PhB57]|jgi:hypothetical protein|uniref:hypothetical protein n=1 Tax=unclassified Novosphingobium TaxID=2644732 RepID=UPI00105390DD|nr:hypothetical protein [Novosphingobium sp. PhB57]TCU59662.1 hypothetical protein EDF58_102346 [Novosphingobium sp. PhB57]
MIRKLMTVAAAIGVLAATPSLAANSCRDAQGKFVPCKTVTTKKTTTKVTTAKVTPGVVKGTDGKCRFSSGAKKGQFTKCP